MGDRYRRLRRAVDRLTAAAGLGPLLAIVEADRAGRRARVIVSGPATGGRWVDVFPDADLAGVPVGQVLWPGALVEIHGGTLDTRMPPVDIEALR